MMPKELQMQQNVTETVKPAVGQWRIHGKDGQDNCPDLAFVFGLLATADVGNQIFSFWELWVPFSGGLLSHDPIHHRLNLDCLDTDGASLPGTLIRPSFLALRCAIHCVGIAIAKQELIRR